MYIKNGTYIFHIFTFGGSKICVNKEDVIFTAHKRSLRRLCFNRCLSVYRGGFCPGVSLSRGVSVQEVSVQGGLCPRESLFGGLCPGGHYPGGSLFRGSLFRGSLSRGPCPEGSLSRRGSLSTRVFVKGDLCQGDPLPYGYVWVVCILLESILVEIDIDFQLRI